MKCPRCGESMNYEEFRSSSSESGPWTYDGWHCVYCGEVIDAIVVLNRERSRAVAAEAEAAGQKAEGGRVHRGVVRVSGE